MGTTKVTDPRVSRSVTQALLALKPTGANGIYWGVATDYSSVDKLFRETRTGPYAYLNTWSLKRFIAEYWHWLMLAGVLVAGLTLHPENRGIYTQSDSSKKSSRNIWSLAVVSVDQRY